MIFKTEPLPYKIKKEIISHIDDEIITPEDLSLLTLTHYNFEGKIQNDGQMIVHRKVADNALNVFQALFDERFPIHSIKLMSDFDCDDTTSMHHNNTSGFNFRKIAGTSKLSKHALGLAIDINPIQNPCLYNNEKEVNIAPSAGYKFLNRANIRPGMVESTLSSEYTVVEIFKKNGFVKWGGNWNHPIDWQHFEAEL